MRGTGNDDSASVIADAEGPGPQSAGAPDADNDDRTFRPGSEMTERQFRHYEREANQLYPKVNRRYS
jgi:hypothetical protein